MTDMSEDVREKYLNAGRIARQALEEGAALVKENGSLLAVAERVEGFVRDQGGEPAFPCNISINQDAAHYSPGVGDDLTFTRGDVVKLDMGVHVDGYIGDNALTVEVGTSNHKDLVEASREALRAGVEVVRGGVPVKEVGAAIEATIKSYGFQPIVNLTGHSVDHYHQHAGLSIPNIGAGRGTIEAGMAVAIEPFATDGGGRVKDSGGGNIYHFQANRPQRNPYAKKALEYIATHHDRLPFAARWVTEAVPENKVGFALKLLERTRAVKHYPILREVRDGLVSQHEHTVLVTEDGCEVTTVA